MIDRVKESRNPKKVIRVSLKESYGEIRRVPVNLFEMKRLYLRNTMPCDADVMLDYRNSEICSRYQQGQTKDYEGIVQQDTTEKSAGPLACAFSLRLLEGNNSPGIYKKDFLSAERSCIISCNALFSGGPGRECLRFRQDHIPGGQRPAFLAFLCPASPRRAAHPAPGGVEGPAQHRRGGLQDRDEAGIFPLPPLHT